MTETLVDERSNGGNICGGADGLPLPHKIIHRLANLLVQHVYKTVEIRLWKGLQATWSRLKLSLSLPKLTVTLVLVVWAKQFFSMGCFKSYESSSEIRVSEDDRLNQRLIFFFRGVLRVMNPVQRFESRKMI
ncbi:hypothetical protein V6N13_098628 [Hibiscus sabdariffa]